MGVAARNIESAPRPWSAVVLAGSRPERDVLAARHGATRKALIAISGEEMVARVVRTLLDAAPIARILILADEPELFASGRLEWIARSPRVACGPSGRSIADSLMAVAGTPAAPWPLLVTTADHPLLTPEMVEFFLAGSRESDASIGVVERSVLLDRYPGTKRTWLRFKCGAYTGANLFTVQGERTAAGLRTLAEAEASRKSQLKLLWHFGPLLAVRAAARTVSLETTVDRAARALGMNVRVVQLPFPEAGIDVDTQDDFRLAEWIIARQRPPVPGAYESPPNGSSARRAVSVFDLDRTLTRRGTFTPFLVHAALRRAPWRLLLAPVAGLQFLGYRLGVSTRKQLKERMLSLFLGRVRRDDLARLADSFARRLQASGLHRDGLDRIAAERREGRRIVLATAANIFYVDAIARALGVDEVVCTRATWDGDRLAPRIDGANCYGQDKLDMVCAHFSAAGLDRADLHVRFFSDHPSDNCVLRWADEAFVVNPRRRFGFYASRMGWAVLDWK